MILSICDFTHHPLKSVLHYYSHTIPIQIPCHPSITLTATQAQNTTETTKTHPVNIVNERKRTKGEKTKNVLYFNDIHLHYIPFLKLPSHHEYVFKHHALPKLFTIIQSLLFPSKFYHRHQHHIIHHDIDCHPDTDPQHTCQRHKYCRITNKESKTKRKRTSSSSSNNRRCSISFVLQFCQKTCYKCYAYGGSS